MIYRPYAVYKNIRLYFIQLFKCLLLPSYIWPDAFRLKCFKISLVVFQMFLSFTFFLHVWRQKSKFLCSNAFKFPNGFYKVITLTTRYSCLAKRLLKINDFAIFSVMLLPFLCTFYLTIQFYCIFTIFAVSHVLFVINTYFFVISHVISLLSVTCTFVTNTR